jgi:hypothetical protein
MLVLLLLALLSTVMKSPVTIYAMRVPNSSTTPSVNGITANTPKSSQYMMMIALVLIICPAARISRETPVRRTGCPIKKSGSKQTGHANATKRYHLLKSRTVKDCCILAKCENYPLRSRTDRAASNVLPLCKSPYTLHQQQHQAWTKITSDISFSFKILRGDTEPLLEQARRNSLMACN